jgi:hypothetical protein
MALALFGQRLVQPDVFAQDRTCASPVDWTTLASTYTHDTEGRRVDRFAMHVEPYAIERSDYQQSGFRHSRSTLQAGTSSDHYHSVERWGAPVQPYGEWRYPYRPFAVPYGAWGPQSPAVNVQGGGGWYGRPGLPFPHGAAGHDPYGHAPYGHAPGGHAPSGYGPGGYGPGGYGPGEHFPGGNGGATWNNGFGVGPSNALRPDQDDYYAPAPEPPPVSDRDFFYSPYRP